MPGGFIGLTIVSAVEVLLGVIYGYYGLSEVMTVGETPIPSMFIHAYVQVFLALAFLAGGIGLFFLKEWGRRLNLVIAVLFGLYALVSLIGVLLTMPGEEIKGIAPFLLIKVVFFILSVLLFYYLTRPAVKGAFGKPEQT